MSISALSSVRPSGHSPGPLATVAGNLLRAILLWPSRVYANRQLLHTMAGMSDSELSDIGLTRQDLSDSTALPLSSETDTFLAARVSERRRWH